MRRKIIMDCDTGRDDALAIALALASPNELELLGITAVAGNVPLELTQRNARLICDLANNRDIKVFAGEAASLQGAQTTAQTVHGETGLQGLDVFEPSVPLQKLHGVDFIIETLSKAQDNEIILVPTGPLTNIARMIERAPDLLSKIQHIVLMGGARSECGNITPTAEFNIYADPHAANLVFECGRPITVISLDLTNQVLATDDHLCRLAAIGTPIAQGLANLFVDERPYNVERFGAGVHPAHDPCTIACLLWPDLISTKFVNAVVDTREGLTFGSTVVDFWNKTERKPNVHWGYNIDVDVFFERFIERIAGL